MRYGGPSKDLMGGLEASCADSVKCSSQFDRDLCFQVLVHVVLLAIGEIIGTTSDNVAVSEGKWFV